MHPIVGDSEAIAHLAAQAVQWCGRRRGAGAHQSETGVGTSILKNVPPGRNVVGKGVAGHVVVVRLCIVDRSNSLVLGGARHWPTSLSDPDRLALAGGDRELIVVPEGGVGVGDAVGLCRLVVRISVHAQEVAGSDQSVLARVGPDVVGVDVAHGLAGRRGACDG